MAASTIKAVLQGFYTKQLSMNERAVIVQLRGDINVQWGLRLLKLKSPMSRFITAGKSEGVLITNNFGPGGEHTCPVFLEYSLDTEQEKIQ